MRLDKFLCDINQGTRSQVKEAIRKGMVSVNGVIQKKPDFQVKETSDEILYCGIACSYHRFAYYMLHKPAGVVSATKDNRSDTVMSLLTGVTEKGLFPVGRLDKDTEGLLLITNDGELAHRLLSPKKHVDKTYFVHIRQPLTKEEQSILEQGVDIGDKQKTLPAKIEEVEPQKLFITIQEGRFHQVKRMFHAVGNEVLYLKRLSFGSLTLEEELPVGKFRPLSKEEIWELQTKF